MWRGRIGAECGERTSEVEEKNPVCEAAELAGVSTSRWSVSPGGSPLVSWLPSPAAVRSQASALSQDGEDKTEFQVG